MRKLPFIVTLLLCAGSVFAQKPDIKKNIWTAVPSVTYAFGPMAGKTGAAYRDHAWTMATYDGVTGKGYFYEGYEDSDVTTETNNYYIYSGAVWEFNINTSPPTMTLKGLVNWKFNSGTTELEPTAANTGTPTPAPRHSTFAAVPDKGYLFIGPGLDSRIRGGGYTFGEHPADTWKFTYSSSVYEQITSNGLVSGAHVINPVTFYHAATGKVVMWWTTQSAFGSATLTRYDVNAGTFAHQTSFASKPGTATGSGGRGGNSGDVRTVDGCYYAFGLGSTESNELWRLCGIGDANATWEQLFPSGGPPAVRTHHVMLYLPRWDKFLIAGGNSTDDPTTGTRRSDTWIYDPAANSYTDITSTVGALPNEPGQGTYQGTFMDGYHDAGNDTTVIQIFYQNTENWQFVFLRYQPSCGDGLLNDLTSNFVEGVAGRPSSVGSTIMDEKLGGCVTRKNTEATLACANNNCTHDYSELPAWDRSGAYILGAEAKVFKNSDGTLQANFPSGFSCAQWSPVTDGLLIGIKSLNQIWSWNVITDAQTGPLFTASESTIDCDRSKQPISRDGRYKAVTACTGIAPGDLGCVDGDGYNGGVYVVDLQGGGAVVGTKLAIPYTAATCGSGNNRRPDWAQAAPDTPTQDLIINWGNVSGGSTTTGCGHELFDPQTATRKRNLHAQSQHSSVGVKGDGTQYLVTVDNNGAPQYGIMVPLATGTAANLFQFTYNGQDFHVSALAYGKDYVAFSTEYGLAGSDDDVKTCSSVSRTGGTATFTCDGHGFSTGNKVITRGVADSSFNGQFVITGSATNTFTVAMTGSGSSTGGWVVRWRALDMEISRVFLDSTVSSPHVERLAHARGDGQYASDNCGSAPISYWVQPHASLNWDGTKIGFGSNWGPNCFAEFYEITGFSTAGGTTIRKIGGGGKAAGGAKLF